MKKLLSFFLVFTAILFISARTFAQDDSLETQKQMTKELLFYKDIYRYADSCDKVKSQDILPKRAFAIADSLDKLDPVNYFYEAGSLMAKRQYNEASFVFYLGMLRFRYYNSADPDYKPSDGGALLASLETTLGEPIRMYLQTNIDHYIAILKASSDWALKNDYKYFPKNKSPQKYNGQLNGINSLITEMQKNREKYIKQWDKERVEMEKNIDSALKQYDQSSKNKK